MCKCGHAKSQHSQGPCDYTGYSCTCDRYQPESKVLTPCPILDTGAYVTRDGHQAVIQSLKGSYAYGYVLLKITRQQRCWNREDGTKTCYSKHGHNPQDIVRKAL